MPVNPGNTRGGGNLTPLGFLRNPLEFFGTKLGNPRGFNLWSLDGRFNVVVDPTQSYGKIQQILSKIFIDFAIKPINIYFSK